MELHNEFLKEHAKNEEQEATIAELRTHVAKQEAMVSQLKKEIETLVACIKEHDSRIEKVSDQVEMRNSMPQMVMED